MRVNNARTIFKSLKVGDIFYHINPMGCGASAQKSVEITVIKVTAIERKFLGLFGDNIIYYKGCILDNDRAFLNDLDNYSCKFTTTCLKEAEAYLKTIHAGAEAVNVNYQHTRIKANTR